MVHIELVFLVYVSGRRAFTASGAAEIYSRGLMNKPLASLTINYKEAKISMGSFA